jgi:MraZ protein
MFGAKWRTLVEGGDAMLLTGTFHRSLDEKLRLPIPRPLRDALGPDGNAALYVAPGTDGSLEVYSEQAFTRLAAQLEVGPRNDREIRAFHRLFYGQVQRIEIDKQGRVRLPAELAQLAALDKDIVLVGVRDHIEIWNEQRWKDFVNSTQPHYDELAERATPDVIEFPNSVRRVGEDLAPRSSPQEGRPLSPR